MASKMATVDKALELLEKIRSASWDPAVQGTLLVWFSVDCLWPNKKFSMYHTFQFSNKKRAKCIF